MTGEDIFKITMAMIDEMLTSGELDAETTADYRAKAPYILTMLQAELVGIENRYRKKEDYIFPVPIISLNQTFQVDTTKVATLLTNGLAAHLMLDEDKAKANFFQSRYEELRAVFLKSTARSPEKRTDVYDALLNY